MTRPDGTTQRLTTRSIVIATGARPTIPPIPGIDRVSYLTSDNVWELRELPRRLVVLGGGPIGCEMTQAFARLSSQVTQVEMEPRILSREDPEVSALVTQRFRAEGIDVRVGHRATHDAPRRRLAYWDITEPQIARIEQTGEVTKTLTLVSPVNGVVLEKNVLEGQRFMAGTPLYRIADLSSVWAEGDVFEQDLQFVHVGSRAHITVSAYPGEQLTGRVSFVYPTVDQASRTNRVRVTVPNPGLKLKPGMYATIYFDVTIGPNVLAVPMQAVVVTGERNVVFVRDAQGMLMPRDVVLGTRAGDQVQVLSGLTAGETIVGAANFLVDAESRLASAGNAMPGMPGMQMGAPAAADDSAAMADMPGMAPAPAPPPKAAATPDTMSMKMPERDHD